MRKIAIILMMFSMALLEACASNKEVITQSYTHQSDFPAFGSESNIKIVKVAPITYEVEEVPKACNSGDLFQKFGGKKFKTKDGGNMVIHNIVDISVNETKIEEYSRSSGYDVYYDCYYRGFALEYDFGETEYVHLLY